MNLTRNQIIIIGIGTLIVIVVVLIFTGVIPGLQQGGGGQQTVQLTIFGVENERNFRDLIDSYVKLKPGIKITYTQFSKDDFEKNVLEALAAGRGPDIISFHNSWLTKHFDKIVPAPVSQISLNQVEQLFPQIVEQNLVSQGRIYSLPLYIDTLAMFYNKDTFDAKSIALQPRNWTEFQALIPKLREVNNFGQLVKPAAAIGGSGKSIDTAAPLLNLLLMQFGGPSVDNQGEVKFGEVGADAFNFYLSFGNAQSTNYTWNDNLRYSLDNFSQGGTAVIFNYNSAIPLIKNRNAFLNLGIAPIPQLAGAGQPINLANYWGLAVTNQSRNPAWAWDFIITATTNSQLSDAYLKSSNQPPALRSLINNSLDDPKLGVFARQALTARAWRGPASAALNQIFSNMIESVLTGRLSQNQAVAQAENEINSLK